MEHSQQTIQQVDRALERTISRFPINSETTIFTDIHLTVSQDSGELLSFDDDGNELNRAVISDWIENKEENFFTQVTTLLRHRLKTMNEKIEQMGIVKPFSFILEDEETETSAELYVADDDTIIIGENLMEGLGDDLDNFLKKLMQE